MTLVLNASLRNIAAEKKVWEDIVVKQNVQLGMVGGREEEDSRFALDNQMGDITVDRITDIKAVLKEPSSQFNVPVEHSA